MFFSDIAEKYEISQTSQVITLQRVRSGSSDIFGCSSIFQWVPMILEKKTG